MAVVALLMLAATTASCSAAGPAVPAAASATAPRSTAGAQSGVPRITPSPAVTSAISAELLGPDGAVAKDQAEIPLVVRVMREGKPLSGGTVTFAVLEGPAVFPDGFETAQTDATGVATALSLSPTGTGSVRIEVAADDFVGNVTIEIR